MARSPKQVFSRRLKSEALLSKSGLRRAYGGSYPAEPIPSQSCTYPLSATLAQIQALDSSIANRLSLSNGDQRGAFTIAGVDQTYAAAPASMLQRMDLSSGDKQLAVRLELPALEFGGTEDADISVLLLHLFSPSTQNSLSVVVNTNLRYNDPPVFMVGVHGRYNAGGFIEVVGAGTHEVGLHIDAGTGNVRVKFDGAPVDLSIPINNFEPANDYTCLMVGYDSTLYTNNEPPLYASPANAGKVFAMQLVTSVSQITHPFDTVQDLCVAMPPYSIQ